MHYRREIDGLRTLAVIPVILFHAGVPLFAGGYAGVDVFFVISGYLITSILISDLDSGRFSLLEFYERRARRILPALAAVMLACLPFAFAWMQPHQLAAFGSSLVAVCLFAANILFWREDDYFAAAAEEKPLLHTWSLAVEEQYYLFFPLLLWLMWKGGRSGGPHRGAVLVLAGLALASLALAETLVRRAPSAAFYLILPRAWELLVGSLCAFAACRGGLRRNGTLAAAGLLAVAISVVAFDRSTPFPSLYALLPVAGTALIILHGTPGTVVARLLSLPPMAGIGLISYSAYLWHQPLFAFARLRSFHEPELPLMLLLAALSLVLAYLTWRFVEQPFRRSGRLLAPRRSLFAAAAAAAVALSAAGLVLAAGQGWPQRYPQVAALALERNELPSSRGCVVPAPFDADLAARCLRRGPAPVIVIGDSHARALYDAVFDRLSGTGRTVTGFLENGCLPVPQTSRLPLGTGRSCRSFVAASQRFLQRHPGVPVVLVSRWALNVTGSRFDNGEGGREPGTGLQIRVLAPDGQVSQASLTAHIQAELAALAQHRPLILLRQFPEAGWNVPDQVSKSLMFRGVPPLLTTSLARYKERNAAMAPVFAALAAAPGVAVVDPAALLCGTRVPGRCLNFADGVSYYTDDDHPSRAAADLIAAQIAAALERLERPGRPEPPPGG